MKFCPSCGSQLVDEAKFCPHCGAKQPNMVDNGGNGPLVFEQPKGNNIQPVINQEKSPSPRYNDLDKNNELFRTAVNARRKKYLFELIFIVFIIPFIVALTTPVVLFTGINATGEGAEMMSAVGMSLPYQASAFDFIEIDALSGSKAIAPGSMSAVFSVMELIFGIIFSLLLTAMPIIGAFTGRGYVLKLYESGKMDQLYKEIVQPPFGGGVFCLMPLVAPMNLYVSSMNVKYEAGKTYLFGEIQGITSGFIAVVVVAVLTTVLSIVGVVVANAINTKKFKAIYKQYRS